MINMRDTFLIGAFTWFATVVDISNPVIKTYNTNINYIITHATNINTIISLESNIDEVLTYNVNI